MMELVPVDSISGGRNVYHYDFAEQRRMEEINERLLAIGPPPNMMDNFDGDDAPSQFNDDIQSIGMSSDGRSMASGMGGKGGPGSMFSYKSGASFMTGKKAKSIVSQALPKIQSNLTQDVEKRQYDHKIKLIDASINNLQTREL
jgi:hypothetical protein